MSFRWRFSAALLVLSAASCPVFAQGPAGYAPANPTPVMTASASSPVTVSILRYNPTTLPIGADGKPITPKGSPFSYTLTITDNDTYVAVLPGNVQDFKPGPDFNISVITTPASLQYADVHAPVLQGTAEGGKTIFTVSGFGLAVPTLVPVGGEIRYNTYTIHNNLPPGSLVLDASIVVVQTIHIPASYP
jgi:hypothetical protein